MNGVHIQIQDDSVIVKKIQTDQIIVVDRKTTSVKTFVWEDTAMNTSKALKLALAVIEIIEKDDIDWE